MPTRKPEVEERLFHLGHDGVDASGGGFEQGFDASLLFGTARVQAAPTVLTGGEG